jgi:hypothetical protein
MKRFYISDNFLKSISMVLKRGFFEKFVKSFSISCCESLMFIFAWD